MGDPLFQTPIGAIWGRVSGVFNWLKKQAVELFRAWFLGVVLAGAGAIAVYVGLADWVWDIWYGPPEIVVSPWFRPLITFIGFSMVITAIIWAVISLRRHFNPKVIHTHHKDLLAGTSAAASMQMEITRAPVVTPTIPKTGIRDVWLRDAIWYAQSGKWEPQPSNPDTAEAVAQELCDLCVEFRNRAFESAIPIWGKQKPADELWRPIPATYWADYEINYLYLLEEPPEVLCSQVANTMAKGLLWDHLMTNRALVESIWVPRTDTNARSHVRAGDVTIHGGNFSAGDGGPGGPGGNFTIKAGDANSRTDVNKASSASNLSDTPIWRAIAHVAAALNEKYDETFLPKARIKIRQAALDEKIQIRGRRQIDRHPFQTGLNFSDVHSNIARDYWNSSVLNILSTSELSAKEYHTDPETGNSWGPKGIEAVNRYSDLRVNMSEIEKI